MLKKPSVSSLQVARTAKQIGEALRRKRRSLRLTQADLAARAGMRQATVSALERGEARLDTLIHMLAALGLELVVRDRGAESEVRLEDIF